MEGNQESLLPMQWRVFLCLTIVLVWGFTVVMTFVRAAQYPGLIALTGASLAMVLIVRPLIVPVSARPTSFKTNLSTGQFEGRGL